MKKALIGVLAWDCASSDTLSNLENMPGNILHPETFNFPLKITRVKGANYKTIVESSDFAILENMISSARMLKEDGVKVITTSCGFNAFFQDQLADAVDIPVFASSLIQVPMVSCSLKPRQAVGIITAEKRCLTREHFVNTGILAHIPLRVAEVAKVGEFASLRNDPAHILNADLFISQVTEVAEKLVKDNPDIGAIVLECTDLPPCSAAIRKSTGLAVFDITTLLNMVHSALA